MEHGKSTGTNVHRIVAFTYANAAARLAAVSADFTAEDIDKVAKQVDNGSRWTLDAISPAVVWSPFGGGTGTITPLSSVRYADSGTIATSQDGSIGSPFDTLAAALASAPDAGAIYLAPGAYAGVQNLTKSVVLAAMDTVVEGAAASGDLLSSGTGVDTLNVATGLGLTCFDLNISTISLIDDTCSLQTQRCRVVGAITAGASPGFIIGNSTFYAGAIAAAYLDATNCKFAAAITMKEGDCSFWNCAFTTITVTYVGLAGTVYMDALSYAAWLASGSTLVNGTIVVVGYDTNTVRSLRMTLTHVDTQLSTKFIPVGAVIHDCLVNITVPFTAGTLLKVGRAGSLALMQGTSDNDTSAANIYGAPQDTSWGGVDEAAVVTLQNGDAIVAGAGFVTILYSIPNA